VKLRTEKQLLSVPFDEWTEAEFQHWACRKLQKAGWHVIQFQASMIRGRWITATTEPWVDVVAIRPPRLLLLELKREKHWAWKPGQEPLMRKLQACADATDNVEAYVVHPSDARTFLRVIARTRSDRPPAQMVLPGGTVTSVVPPVEGAPHDPT
jgi:hypothetical protein